MTGWTLFLITVGVVFLTAQFFRLIDLIERPSRRPALYRKTLPTAWSLCLWTALCRVLEEKPWMSWKN